MKQNSWSKLGLVASIGALAMPVVLALRAREEIAKSYESSPKGVAIAALCIGFSMLVQGVGIFRLLMGSKVAKPLARLAQFHALVALIVLGGATFSTALAESPLCSAWIAGWFGPIANETSYLPLNLLPLLLLAQWVFLTRASEPEVSSREIWRAIAVGSIAVSSLLGTWVISPLFSADWKPFTDPVHIFFSTGVIVHLIALWQILSRSRFDWLWAGLIGFGCLISGSILTGFFNGKLIGEDNTVRQIGGVLHLGWFTVAPYLPIAAYVLTGLASVRMFRDRSLARAPGTVLPIQGRTELQA